MIATIVKIDLVGSKSVAAANQIRNPMIRKQLLDRLLEVSKSKFPQSDKKYPSGSYYRAEGDAVYFILDKPTVALRAAVEFMQSWFNVRLPDLDRCPDCRIMIDRGDIQTVETPAGDDFVSAAFENIAVAEKGLQGGRVFASRDVVENCDKTLARFVFYSSIQPRQSEKIEIYLVEFLDPRTTVDSSLLHALFITHPKTQTARDRILELFILEYLLEKKSLVDFSDFNRWAGAKSYPRLPIQTLKKLCDESTYLNSKTGAGGTSYSYTLTLEGLATLEQARKDFGRAREECIDTVQSTIAKQCGTAKATDEYDIATIIDQYLCALFSEIRMMANYFRETSQLFDAEANELERFDYILRKHLPFTDGRYFREWRSAFVEGLRAASGGQNAYVAAVFHNVLATYYLNRSTKASAYQLDKLAERRLYIDTNVLYALKVPASNYHEAVKYFIDRLAGLQIAMRVFPFTLEEYENSLLRTELEVRKNEVSAFILRWNPWLYQEFMLNKPRYLGKIEVCRRLFSVAKDKAITPQFYDAIDSELKENGLCLERDFVRLCQEERDALWAEMRQYMTSSNWSIEEFYDFIHESTKSLEVITHDTDCVHNLIGKAGAIGRDELGPKLMFVTLDRQLARTRKKYEFIVSSEQFLEFMMPYLFLTDIPVKDAEKFPNQLLSAQLGTLLEGRTAEATDLVRGYLTDPSASAQYAKGQLGPVASEIARTLSSSRFEGVVAQARELEGSKMEEVADQIATKFAEMELQQKVSYFENQAVQSTEFKSILNDKDKQITRLQRTLKYLKQQRQKGNRG
ncbi:MAG: hypothetical protein ACLPLR_09065 [Terriglobales bacterium]